MDFQLRKSEIVCGELANRLLDRCPTFIRFKTNFRGWKYSDDNLKISIKHNLLNSDYVVSVKLCGLKSKCTMEGSITSNYGLMKYIVLKEVAKVCGYYDIPQDIYIANNIDNLIYNNTFVTLVAAYNLERDVTIHIVGIADSIISLQFKPNNIMKLTIKNDSEYVKSYYNQAGSIRSKVLGLIRVL
jgi:hypothetical protein